MSEILNSIWSFTSLYWEGIAAISAILLTAIHIRSVVRHNKLSVRPFLGTSTHTYSYKDKEGNDWIVHEYYLGNQGLGPAEIVNFCTYYKNELLAKNNISKTNEDVISLCQKHFSKSGINVYSYTSGGVIPAGVQTRLLRLELPVSKEEEQQHLSNFLDNFHLVIDYKSFYNQSYCFDSDTYKNQ
ncbi:MAG: hypothetical protein GW778_04850 [Alphaproteobacteria bacterium]|nr:hypothetical protein [Alphaproteobacteria bacterium]